MISSIRPLHVKTQGENRRCRLNFRVRDGTGCCPTPMTANQTNYSKNRFIKVSKRAFQASTSSLVPRLPAGSFGRDLWACCSLFFGLFQNIIKLENLILSAAMRETGRTGIFFAFLLFLASFCFHGCCFGFGCIDFPD